MLTEGRFGQTFLASEFPLQVAPREEYRLLPLTVECWARLDSKQRYNILVANEPKVSGTHWELYTHIDSGFPAVYFPDNTPPDVVCPMDITDGQWHHLAFVADGARVRLYLDGQLGADVAVRHGGAAPVPGPLAFGQLAEGGLGCDGLVDEVRLTRGVREVKGVPEAPLAADERTIGLWHFEAPADGRFFADASVLANHAVDPLADAPFRKPRWAPGSRVAMPPEPDLAAVRRQLADALRALGLRTPRVAGSTRDGVLRVWEEQWFSLQRQLSGEDPLPPGAAQQVYDRQALVFGEDGDPLGVTLRRTAALVDHLRRAGVEVETIAEDLRVLRSAAESTPTGESTRRHGLFLAACALSREVAFANPVLDFDRILFVARSVYAGSRKTGPVVTADNQGQHFATQYYGFNSIPGGGLYAVRDFRTEPVVEDILGDSVVANGRLAGQRLQGGGFLSPELSHDGRTILFSWTACREQQWKWTPDTTFHIFRVAVDGSGLTQLTDGPYNDFDACFLPNGRIAFISERRGGYIRCFSGLDVPQHSLHSMRLDGTDLLPLSFFETSEWHPSVNNDGMLVYTRWDYVDRENCLGSNIWTCTPDGRDARAPHGNYPYPWHTFADNTAVDSRHGRPYTEMSIRAIPGSHRYLATAAPHHGEAFGSLVVLDLRLPDDGGMSQLQRVTPYVPFPETEYPARSQYPYGTAWPLNEDFYLCNWWENLYLLDRYGNQTLLCENDLVFGEINWNMRLIDPIPLRPRPVPPALPVLTNEGDAARPNAPFATISVLNVYNSDLPFPPGTRIRYLRVLQNILKLNPQMGQPMIGYQEESTPRIPLGIVPVEEDGSAYFEAPVERELIFQALDENQMAVQSMRSVAYVHRGENLTCLGCHETKEQAPPLRGYPLALRRAPSRLEPEVGPVEPITYYRLVKPVFERTCLTCHRQTGKGLQDMGYTALEPYAFYFAGGMSGTTVKPIHGGSRTIPGRFGARNSRIGQALLDETHRGKVPLADFRRVVLWLDANSLRLGAFHDEEAQMRGEVIWPTLDVDPTNPQGLERLMRRRAPQAQHP